MSTQTHFVFYLTHHLQYCQPFSFTGTFPSPLTSFIVTPFLNKPSHDKDLTNYRQISNLSTISKITERVVKTRLFNHLSSNSLLNPYQSAYSKIHSTETTLLSLHDHLSNAIAHQHVSWLCLLINLSAAFDTLDYSILLTRLSTWLGIFSISLSWFRSYLSSGSSSVSICGTPSNIIISCGVPQDSVIGPIIFNLYTTPFITLIANTSLSRHLYADDTQLFTSFVLKDFSFVINQLQSFVSTISSWMTANLLHTLNPSKTGSSAYLSSYPKFTILHFPFRLLNQFFLVHLHAI